MFGSDPPGTASLADRVEMSPRVLRFARVAGVASTLAFIAAMVSMVRERATFAIDLAVFHLGGRFVGEGGYTSVYDRDLFRATLESDYRPESDLADSLTYFISPPPFAWLSQGIAAVPFESAVLLWLLLGAAGLMVSVRLLGLPWWSSCLVASTPAVVMNTTVGQSGLFFLLLAVLVHRAIAVDRKILAGLLVGLFILKPPLAIGWVLWWLLDWRRWNRAIGAACFSSLVVVSPTLGSGLAAWRSYLSVLSERVGDESSLQVNSMSLAEFVKLLAPNSSGVATVSTWILSILVGALVLRMAMRRWPDDRDVLSGVSVVATVAISPHLSVYDTGLLLIPCAVLVGRSVMTADRMTLLWALYVCSITFGPLWFVGQYNTIGRGVGLEFPALVVMCVLGARWLVSASVPVLADATAIDGQRENLVVGE